MQIPNENKSAKEKNEGTDK